MIAACVRSGKCQWRSIELGNDLDLAHELATAHTATTHPQEYMYITQRDSVPVLSMLEEMQLAFYTDYQWESIL